MWHAGPIQYDAAVDPDIAKQKIKQHSEVAGQANVLIFPDLNTGNNTYKVSSLAGKPEACAFSHLNQTGELLQNRRITADLLRHCGYLRKS